jgi:hypothetical protein
VINQLDGHFDRLDLYQPVPGMYRAELSFKFCEVMSKLGDSYNAPVLKDIVLIYAMFEVSLISFSDLQFLSLIACDDSVNKMNNLSKLLDELMQSRFRETMQLE